MSTISPTGTRPFALALVLDTAALERPTLAALAAVVRAAEAAGADVVTLADHLVGDEGDTAPRLDAALATAALGPLTGHIGLVPEVASAVTEPFHVATAVQTIDHDSLGRAGLRLRPGLDPAEHATLRHRSAGERFDTSGTGIDRAAVLADAQDTLDVIARLWESWEPDAVIRDVASGRFLDRERVHDAGFTGGRFTVEGASITPRSPQGRPPVFLLVDDADLVPLAASADIVIVPSDLPQAPALARALREQDEQLRAARSGGAGGGATGGEDGAAAWRTAPQLIWAETAWPGPDAAGLFGRLVEAGYDGVSLVLPPSEHRADRLAAALAPIVAALPHPARQARPANQGDPGASARPAEPAPAPGAAPPASGTTLRARLGLPVATNPFTAARTAGGQEVSHV